MAKVEGWPPVQANVLRKVRTGSSKQAWPESRAAGASRRLGKPGKPKDNIRCKPEVGHRRCWKIRKLTEQSVSSDRWSDMDL